MTQEYGVNVFNRTMNPHGVVTLTRLFVQVLLQEMNCSSVDEKGYFRKEMVLSDNALKCAEVVLALDGGPLEQFKALLRYQAEALPPVAVTAVGNLKRH